MNQMLKISDELNTDAITGSKFAAQTFHLWMKLVKKLKL